MVVEPKKDLEEGLEGEAHKHHQRKHPKKVPVEKIKHFGIHLTDETGSVFSASAAAPTAV